MLSDFQRAKLDRRFELLDADGDGHITAEDYDMAAVNVCQAIGFGPGSPQYEQVHAMYQRLWAALCGVAGRQHGERISRDQFLSACERLIVGAEEGYERLIAPIVTAVFDLSDTDARGELGIEQLTTWFNAYGVCADDAEHAFEACDRNGDGLLDLHQVHKAVRDFYTGDDQQLPGTRIFGPLPVVAGDRAMNGSGKGYAAGFTKPNNGAANNGAANNGVANNGNGNGNGSVPHDGAGAARGKRQNATAAKKGGRKQNRTGSSATH
ncbi:hypothetical protein KGA66_07650 [Actinocrinis puniceicyclus]|uniref:EF-hand domain-containing protein n=1 Tax=Actinocrinis puniceicyclus TaxID=977794 RepID=A0A8J7WNE7_9ACTN|nr:hypothetical protein [Actinocrinis puniceicyclus]MBS2962912.1 hypothetical protein [Actinocrinis puniceicyclus]